MESTEKIKKSRLGNRVSPMTNIGINALFIMASVVCIAPILLIVEI